MEIGDRVTAFGLFGAVIRILAGCSALVRWDDGTTDVVCREALTVIMPI
jgi:hypothetical protein